MKARRGRWLGVIIAVVAVGGLAIASLGGAGHAGLPAGLAISGSSATGSGVPGFSTATAFDFLWKFVVVVALLGGSLWLLRKYAGANRGSRGRTGAISVVDTISLAQGRALYVLDLGDRALVVGATQQQITALADVTDPEILSQLRSSSTNQSLNLNGLARRFNPKLKLEEARRGASREEEALVKLEPSAAVAAVNEEIGADSVVIASPMPAGDFAEALSRYSAPAGVQLPAMPAPPRATPPAATPDSAAALRALAERLRARRQSA